MNTMQIAGHPPLVSKRGITVTALPEWEFLKKLAGRHATSANAEAVRLAREAMQAEAEKLKEPKQ